MWTKEGVMPKIKFFSICLLKTYSESLTYPEHSSKCWKHI